MPNSFALLVGSSAVAQVLALLRTLYVAANIGVAPELDAAIVAMTLPNMFANLIVNSLGAAIVPAYVRAYAADPRKSAALGGGAVVVAAALGLAGSGLAYVLAGQWVAIAAPGFGESLHEVAAGLAAATAATVVLGALSGVLSGIAQASGRHGWLAVGWLAGGISAFLWVILGWDAFGVLTYATAPVVSFAVTVGLLLAVSARTRLIWLSFATRDTADIRDVVRKSFPLLGGTAFAQLNEVIDRAVASTISVGAVSLLRYADQIARGPVSLVVPGFNAATLPAIASGHHRQEASLWELVAPRLRSAIELSVPVAIALAAVAPLGVSVLYTRGEFAIDLLPPTAWTVTAMSPLLVVAMVNSIAAAAYLSAGQTRTLGLLSIAGAGLNLLLDVLLAAFFGVPGIGLATTLSAAAVAGLLLARIVPDRRAVFWLLGHTTRTVLASSLAALPVAVLAWTWGMESSSPIQLARLIALLLLGILIQSLAARAIGARSVITFSREAWARR